MPNTSGERTESFKIRFTINQSSFDLEADIIDLSVASSVTYAYDAFNQLIRRSHDADGEGSGTPTDTFYSHHGGQIALQFDSPTSTTTYPTHRYLWNPAAIDQLLADEKVTSSAAGTVLWPLADHLGTIRDLAEHNSTTGDTTIVNHRTYDAWGNILSETNSAVDTLFSFTGRLYDEVTGLQNNLHRWYDPLTGRWISEDPTGLGPDTNPYRYVKNSPTNLVDPSGLEGVPPTPETRPVYKPGTFNHDWEYFIVPWHNPPRETWFDTCTKWGKWAGEGMAAIGTVGAIGVELLGVGGTVVIGGTGTAAGTVGPGIGTIAVTPATLPAGVPLPGIMVNGTVYVAHHHSVAWALAGGCGVIQRYGHVILDKSGKVVAFVYEWNK
jgi:RHS repeat-associated protein